MMKDYFDFQQKYMNKYFDIQERRIREDCMLEKELLLELEEFVQLKILKKYLRIKDVKEKILTKEKIDVITLNEESNEEQGIRSDKLENGRKKERISQLN